MIRQLYQSFMSRDAYSKKKEVRQSGMSSIYFARPLLMTFIGSLSLVSVAYSAPLPALSSPYSYKIIDQDIQTALTQFGSNLGVRTNIDASIQGRVVDNSPTNTAREFLERLSETHNFEWYYDGQVLHVTPAQASVSRLLALNVVPLSQLVQSLRALDIYDERFPIKSTPNSAVALVTGPSRFVALVENALNALAEVRPPSSAPGSTVVQTVLPNKPVRPLIVYRGANVQVLNGAPVTAPPQAEKNSSE